MENMICLLDRLASRAEINLSALFVPGCACCAGAEIWFAFEDQHIRVCERQMAALAPCAYRRVCAQLEVAPLPI
jgi:hypothetical protein